MISEEIKIAFKRWETVYNENEVLNKGGNKATVKYRKFSDLCKANGLNPVEVSIQLTEPITLKKSKF